MRLDLYAFHASVLCQKKVVGQKTHEIAPQNNKFKYWQDPRKTLKLLKRYLHSLKLTARP